jgi:hypothetical protein
MKFNLNNMKKITIILGIITTLTLNSCGVGKSVECECVDELNTMNYTSEKYNKCIDIAISAKADSPLDYFKSKCEEDK